MKLLMPTRKFKELISFTKRSDSKDFLNTTIQKENPFLTPSILPVLKRLFFGSFGAFQRDAIYANSQVQTFYHLRADIFLFSHLYRTRFLI